MSLAQCDKRTAEKYLRRNRWSMNYALNDYYDTVIGSYVGGPLNVRDPIDYPEELCKLYENYAAQDGGIIDSEGLVRLIEDLQYSLDDLVTLCLAKLLNCKNLADGISKESFLLGFYNHGCSTLEQIRHTLEDLDTNLETNIDYFTEIYRYTFDLVVDPDKRHLDLDTAVEYWNIFCQPKYPLHIEKRLLELWVKFLKDENKSVISKDSWQMVIVFFKKFPTIDAIKSTYNEADAWPYIIDEFYEYLLDNNAL